MKTSVKFVLVINWGWGELMRNISGIGDEEYKAILKIALQQSKVRISYWRIQAEQMEVDDNSKVFG